MKEYMEFVIPVECGTLPQSQLDWYLQKSKGKMIIRCKKCKSWNIKTGECTSDDVLRQIHDCGCGASFHTDGSWFCPYGEYIPRLKTVSRMPENCASCQYFRVDLKDEHDEMCSACTLLPCDDPWGCGYEIIDGINTQKQRAAFCPLKNGEQDD